MPNGPVFEATWARCLQHKTLLEPGESECMKCRILERDLSLIPPFKVYCVRPEWGEAKTGETYEVEWVVKKGRRSYGEMAGYAFKISDEAVNDHLFDPENFIPHEYLTEDLKDSWLTNEEPEKPDFNPVLTDDDFYGAMG